MRKLMFLAVLSLIFSVGQAKATTCTANTLNNYVTEGSCSYMGLNFSQFTTDIPTNITPSEIEVTPISNSNGVGFVISPAAPGDWTTTTSSETIDDDFQFVVTCASGTACIDDIYEQLVGSVQATTIGGGSNGVDTLTEVYCLNDPSIPPGSCPSGDTKGEQLLTNTPTNGTVTANPTFSPVSVLSMDKDIEAQSFNTTTATITDLYDQFSLVSTPEPSGFAMLFAGLLGLALFSLRRKGIA